MQNPTTLKRAICLAKKADVAIQMSRQPGARGSGNAQQKTKPDGPKPNTIYIEHPGGSYSGGSYSGQKYKQNKNVFNYKRGQSSGNPTWGGFRTQVTQISPPSMRGAS